MSNIGQGVLLPKAIVFAIHSDYKPENKSLRHFNGRLRRGFYIYNGTPYCIIRINNVTEKGRNADINRLLNSIDGFIYHILKYELLTIDNIKKCFKIQPKESSDKFFELLHNRTSEYKFDM